MESSTQDFEKEVAAISAIGAALTALADEAARKRVLSYVISRFFPDGSYGVLRTFAVGSRSPVSSTAPPPPAANARSGEIAGIAKLSDTGELKITARDLKAKSGLDAAVRLAHIAIYAYQELTGQPLSSRHGLTPLLKEWRLYDGNARHRLSKDRGIVRNEDSLTLDAHARTDAEQYIAEILDSDVEGKWKAPR